MRVWEFVTKVLSESRDTAMTDVRVDDSAPIPFEDVFDIEMDKGWLLLKPKKGVKITREETVECGVEETGPEVDIEQSTNA